MRRSIRWRFAIPIALFFILAIFGLSSYLIQAFSDRYQDQIRTTLAQEAHLLASQVEPLITPSIRQPALEARIKSNAADLQTRITVIRADGVVLAESTTDPANMENHANRPEFQQAAAGQDGFAVRYSDTLKANLLYVAVPLHTGNTIPAVIRLARPLAAIEASLNQIRTVIFTAALLLSALAFLIAVLIASYTIRPVVQLTEAARQVAEGNYFATPLPVSDSETGRLSAAFNRMASRIQSQIDLLQNEQAKLRAVLEQMMDGVIVIDHEGQIQLINPAAERMFSIQARQVLGKSAVEVLREYKIIELWRQCQATGAQQNLTLDLIPGNRFLQVIAAPLDQAGTSTTLLLFQDLTRQRRLETIRQDFVSNVSHELRTPLASLKALVETLQEGALEDPPAARRFLERMEVEIDTLTQMVRELLELSRIESGQAPIHRNPIRPLDLLNLPFERMRVQGERAGLAMSIDCPPDLPLVSADAERIQLVVVNLLHNAIKFTPPGGKITLEARQDGSMIIICISDTGVGIPARDLPRIFERFYKADRARSSGGTGLGLSIARHIVEAHGGRIWVESVQTQGSQFFFSLPLA